MTESIKDTWLFKALMREFGAENLVGKFVHSSKDGNSSMWLFQEKLGFVLAQTIVYSPTGFKLSGFDKAILIADKDCIGFEELWKARALIAEADKERREYLESREVKIRNHDGSTDGMSVSLSDDFDGMIKVKVWGYGGPSDSVTINPQDVMDAYQKLWEARYK